MPVDSNFPLRIRIISVAIFLSFSPSVFAQASGNNNLLLFAIIAVAAILILAVVLQVADNLVRIEAKKHDVGIHGTGVIPGLNSLFRPTLPKHLLDKDVYILRKGHDIKLEGGARREIRNAEGVTRYALQPPNWHGIAPIPKLHVETGDSVKAGQPIFYDKTQPDIQHVAPVSGEFIELNRGAKRSIAELVILADREQQYVDFNPPDLDSSPREDIVKFLLESGGWSMIRQRPYDILPHPESEPANIFISTFRTSPLAPDLNLVASGQREAFQKGLDVLGKLTGGKVHLGLNGRDGAEPSEIFTNAEGVEKHYFRGPHPAGNVGIQIHHIDPITPRSKVWYLGVQEVITLGKLWVSRRFDASRVVALTGAPLKDPHYVRTYIGANIGELLKGQLEENHLRLISGDVLSGEKKSGDSFLNFFDDHISVIEEGDHYEMFGWLFPVTPRPSVSRTFPGFLMPDMEFEANTNTHGEQRAFVVTGQYEDLLPMDIYPQHLMKAIMTHNFERMEGLGIHELSEEDIALCEFACTSKQPLQKILREGLEMMREQG